MSTSTADLVVRKSILVDAVPEEAFRIFTEEAASWWPLATHSLYHERATAVVFEPREGGRVFERASDGAEADWGRVVAWEPPTRFAMTWEIGGQATELEVRFTPEAGATRIELEHGGWGRYGDAAGDHHGNYDKGWDFVLGRYAERVKTR